MIDVNKLIADGYTVEKIDDGIYEVKDFISEDDRLFVYGFCESLTDEQWKESYMSNLKSQAMLNFGTDDIDLLVSEHKVIVNEKLIDKSIAIAKDMPTGDGTDKRLWNLAYGFADKLKQYVSGYLVRPFGVIQRHYSGVGLDEHVDQKNDPRLKFACIIYLNNNYAGGELYFPDRGLEFRPAERSLVMFDASDEYLHGVKPVGDGPTRYAMTSFIWDDSVR
jgi:hypothetical protein